MTAKLIDGMTVEQYLAHNAEVVRFITVEIRRDGHLVLHEGDRNTGELCWDEALGTFAELTHPKLGGARYAMRTEADWAAMNRGLVRMRPNPLKPGEGLLPAPTAPTNHLVERIDVRSVHNRLSPSDSEWMLDPTALF